MWLLLSSVAMLLTYNNSLSVTYGGYTGLCSKWLSMSWTLLRSRLSGAHPSAIAAALMMVLGWSSLLKHYWRRIIQLVDEDDDQKVSSKELRKFILSMPNWLLQRQDNQPINPRKDPES